MHKGCLILPAVFAAVYWLERLAVDRLELPHAWIPAVVLAIGVTLLLGSFQGVAQAWQTKTTPETNPRSWQDGQTVRLGGVLRATGRVLQAPFSGREAVVLWYEATAQHWQEGNRQSRPSFRGIDLVPCVLESAAGRFALTGVPRLRDIPEEEFSGEGHLERAASHLVHSEWRAAPDFLAVNAHEAMATFSGDAASLPVNLMNRLAREILGMDDGEGNVETCRQRLVQRKWLLRERLLAAGSEVTVVGTYHANPPRLDIGYRLDCPQHAVVPGAAVTTAASGLRQTLIFVVVLALLTAAGHYLVFSSGGAMYRSLAERVVPS
ncbi:MAG: hypothetical protein V2I32_05560 [Desulforhopalus sp.]|jgi:hypothetical protein|nr:hypothetical protein [Desulforhopalus sp.]